MKLCEFLGGWLIAAAYIFSFFAFVYDLGFLFSFSCFSHTQSHSGNSRKAQRKQTTKKRKIKFERAKCAISLIAS